MTRKQRALLDDLVDLARGDAQLVEAALRDLTETHGRPPRVEEIVDYILDRTAGEPEKPADVDQARHALA